MGEKKREEKDEKNKAKQDEDEKKKKEKADMEEKKKRDKAPKKPEVTVDQLRVYFPVTEGEQADKCLPSWTAWSQEQLEKEKKKDEEMEKKQLEKDEKERIKK